MKKSAAVLIILSLFLLCSCVKNDGQKQYHENVEDIEKYVLETMDRYISFQETEYDEESVSWHIYIRESYTSSNNQDKSYDEICEQSVALIEEYLEEHPEHVLNSYDIYITFWRMKPGHGTRYSDYCKLTGSDEGFVKYNI